ncbi:ATP-binding protein [Fulvitalea axinellae]
MELNPTTLNAVTLERELRWLEEFIMYRLELYFSDEKPEKVVPELPLIGDTPSQYASLIQHYNMSFAERLILILALAPHIRPQVLDPMMIVNSNTNRGYSEFGGIKGLRHGGMLPTGETAVFLVSGTDLAKRFEVASCFGEGHFFSGHKILDLGSEGTKDEPFLSKPLRMSPEYLHFLTSGDTYSPPYSSAFPATRVNTPLEWEDLVLHPDTRDEIEDLLTWARYEGEIVSGWELGKRLKKGYRALFYGPPGTGKTLTAGLLGKALNKEVYTVDLSQIVSKYIGETEKNLAGVFDQAEHRGWILFFDEADALFGQRTRTSSSNDRHANQEVAYLLQRIENFDGMIILATNLKANLDEAFARRFQSIVHFPLPNTEERLSLWKGSFGKTIPLSEDIDWHDLAEEYEIAGGAIINVIRYCAVKAKQRENSMVYKEDIVEGIHREFQKEGRG